MKDVLRAGEAVDKAIETCNTSVQAAKPADKAPTNPFGLLSKEASEARVAAFVNALPTIDGDCAKVGPALEGAKALEGQHDNLDRVLLLANAFQETMSAFKQGLSSTDDQQKGQAAAISQQLVALGDEVGREYDDLVDAPGRKSVGFVCVAQTFCPFPCGHAAHPSRASASHRAEEPLRPTDRRPAPEDGRAHEHDPRECRAEPLQTARLSHRARRGDGPVPTSVSSLVIFGPKGSFSPWQLYQIDQFVLRGGSLVVFQNPWDVSLKTSRRRER